MTKIILLETVPRWDGQPNLPVAYEVEYWPLIISRIVNIRTNIESDDPVTRREVERLLNIQGAAACE